MKRYSPTIHFVNQGFTPDMQEDQEGEWVKRKDVKEEYSNDRHETIIELCDRINEAEQVKGQLTIQYYSLKALYDGMVNLKTSV